MHSLNLNNVGTPQDISILIVDLSKRYGGASTRAILLAENLLPWRVAIAGIENSPVIQLAKAKAIPVKIVGKHRADPLIPFRLANIIRKEHFQVIDTQNIQSKFWASIASFLVKVGFVSTLNSSYESEQGGSVKGKIYQLLDLWTNWRTDRYIAVSETIRINLLSKGIPNDMIDLIRNSFEVDYSIPLDDSASVRLQIGIPSDAHLCVLVGRLVWAKGYDDFIGAFSEVADKISNVYAVIVGDGELQATLSKQIEQAGLKKRILLLGFCETKKIYSLLNAGDVYVMSSRSEGIPFALLEAAALGLPIVATNCGGIPEVVTNNEDALLVPVGDKHALASALITLCTDKQLARKFSFRIKEKIKRDFAHSVQITAIRQSYQNALIRRTG